MLQDTELSGQTSGMAVENTSLDNSFWNSHGLFQPVLKLILLKYLQMKFTIMHLLSSRVSEWQTSLIFLWWTRQTVLLFVSQLDS